LILTLISVVLGVAFVSGSFVLADSLRSIFTQISEDAFAGVDAQVRAIEPEVQSSETTFLRFDDDIVGDVSGLPEVEYAEGGLFAFEQTYSLKDDGEVNRPAGPPVFTASWGGPSPVSSFTIVDGEAPVGQQVALDAAQVEEGGFTVGDQITMSLPTGEPEEFELSAIIDFGEGGTAGSYFNLFDLPTAQRVLGAEGVVDSIVVNAIDGTSEGDLLASIGTVLPSEIEVVSGETVIGEQQEDFDTVISIFGNVLLGFAVVVLFVSTFIIYNTFAILVGQRTQQLGLLRSVGASSVQIRFMVLFESVIIGIVASAVGLFGGLGVAWLLKRLFSTGGSSFPDGPLELLPRTIIVVVVVGLLVTVLSALVPALRASRVSPLEAVRDGGRKERTMTFRLIAGSLVLLPGLTALGLGMFGNIEDTAARLSSIGLGAALTFIGVSMLSALFAGQAAQGIGRPTFVAFASFVGGVILVLLGIGSVVGGLSIFGLAATRDGSFFPIGILLLIAGVLVIAIGYVFVRSGVPTVLDGLRLIKAVFRGGASLTLVNLARDNASRNPQRTAATSTALMIGLALITGVAVLTASLLATFDRLLEDALSADLFIFEENQGLPFSSVLVDQLDALPETDRVAGFAQVEMKVDEEVTSVAAFDTQTGSEVVNVGIVDGTAEVSSGGIAVFTDVANDRDLSIGSTVAVEFEDGFATELTVEAIYDDLSVVGDNWLVSRELSSQHVPVDEIGFVGVTFPDGTDAAAGRAAVEAVTANFPQLSVQDNTEFQEQVESQISQLQIVINGLLVLCLIVAFFGIVNTMALSVLERTREIGLLRAVGMTRDQLRSTIRSEAVVVSVFGALLGVLMGLLLGWAAVVAIPDSFISAVGIPWAQLGVFIIVGAVIGLVAAYFPARRAAQLDVLDAIAHE
ncbi:MAG: ABC transporter permease, partial [Acidimicrobiia bacterium]|nr:ABC transporter permease [Acidimicrobiia bacterium]